MATVRIVETSLRDGNQCLWGALGVDTARTLTVAPAMERAGYKAIDFTTSTHMGVAVRYKREDPWERIRLMAAVVLPVPVPPVISQPRQKSSMLHLSPPISRMVG